MSAATRQASANDASGGPARRLPHAVPWRLVAPPALGLAASAALARWSPLAPQDTLRATLTAVPLVWSLFVALDAGLARGRARIAALEHAAVVLLAAAMAAHPHLGIDSADHLIVAGWAVLVAQRALRTLPGLGRAVRARPPAPAPAAAFLLPLAVTLSILPWSTGQRPPDGDEPWNLLIAHSLAYDLDTDLANNYAAQDSLRFLDRALEPQPGDPVLADGAVFSRHDPAFPLLLAPGYRLGGKLGALLTVAVLTAAAAWSALGLMLRVWPRRIGSVLLQWAVLAMLPPVLLFSHQAWVETSAMLLVVVAFDRLLALEEPSGAPGRRRLWWVVLVACLLLLPLLKLRFGLLSAALGVVALLRLRHARRGLLALGGLGALAGVAYLAVNARLFGNAFRIHSAEELLLFRIPLRDYLANGSGLWFDHAFGLFACAPLWLLLVPGVVTAWRERRRLTIDVAIVALPYLVLVASRREWYGGWSPPFRYALALLPLLALVAVPAWNARRRPRAALLIAPLAVLSAGTTLLFVVEPGWAYAFADGRSHLVDALSRRVGADLAQLLPSATRVRLATWVWPLLVIPALLAFWPWRARGAGRVATRRPAAAMLGVALFAVTAAAAPLVARAWPTRTLEVESPHVLKAGGHVDPEPWVFDRRRFPEAWALREGEHLEAPVRPAGGSVELALHARFIRNRPIGLDLELLCGERLLGVLRWEEHDRWTERRLGPVEWTAGQPLVLRVPAPTGPGEPGVVNGVIVDRIELRWSG